MLTEGMRPTWSPNRLTFTASQRRKKRTRTGAFFQKKKNPEPRGTPVLCSVESGKKVTSQKCGLNLTPARLNRTATGQSARGTLSKGSPPPRNFVKMSPVANTTRRGCTLRVFFSPKLPHPVRKLTISQRSRLVGVDVLRFRLLAPRHGATIRSRGRELQTIFPLLLQLISWAREREKKIGLFPPFLLK